MTRSAFGSIDKLSEGRYRVSHELPRDADGKRRRLSKVVRGTRSDAERVLASMALDAGRVTDYMARDMTLADYWATDYAREISRLSPQTQAGYENDWRLYLEPVLGSHLMAEITSRTARLALLSIPNPSGQKKAFKLLRQMLNVAASDCVIDYNPLPRRMRLDRVQHRETKTYRLSDISTVMDAINGNFCEPFVIIALMCGLRREEVCALRWDDFEFQQVTTIDGTRCRCSIRVERTAQLIRGEVIVGDTKTEKSRRTVVLSGSVAERLRELSGDGWLNPSKKKIGECGNPETVAQVWKTCCKNANIQHIPFTGLRATYSTIQQHLGTPDTLVSMMMGHTQLSTRYSHYLGANVDAQEKAADALDRAIS